METLEKYTVHVYPRKGPAHVAYVYARDVGGAKLAGIKAAKETGFRQGVESVSARLATPRDLGCVPLAHTEPSP